MNEHPSLHPFREFKFCPKCGSSDFVEHDFKAKRCHSCHFTYYFNPSSACTCFITDLQNNLLVAVRKYEPARGTYDLPGGFVDLAETLEEAMAREILEETGIDVTAGERGGIHKPLRYLFSLPNIYLYSGFEVHTVDAVFHLEVESLEPYVGAGRDDVAQLLSIPFPTVRPEEFGLTSIRQAVEMAQRAVYW